MVRFSARFPTFLTLPVLLFGLASCTALDESSNPSAASDSKSANPFKLPSLTATVPLAACERTPLETAPPPQQLKDALAEAEAYHVKYRGTALIVLYQGKIVHERYGDGADAETRPDTQSMMKSVLGLLVGIGIEKGLIGGVDDRIGEYLPEWENDPRGDITVRQMLQMASGLKPASFPALIASRDVNTLAMKAPLTSPPGSKFEYDSAVSQILENIIDRQAKAKGYAGFADFMEREFWCSLGAADATLWVDASGSPHGFAGLNARARDWARIGELIRNKGTVTKQGGQVQRLVSAQWISDMAQPSPTNPQYGYQLWLGSSWSKTRLYNSGTSFGAPQKEPFVAKDTVFFDGFGGERVYVSPSLDLTIVRLGKMTLQYDETVIPNTLSRALASGATQ